MSNPVQVGSFASSGNSANGTSFTYGFTLSAAGDLLVISGTLYSSSTGTPTVSVSDNSGDSGSWSVVVGGDQTSGGGPVNNTFLAYRIAQSTAARTITVSGLLASTYYTAVATEWQGYTATADGTAATQTSPAQRPGSR